MSYQLRISILYTGMQINNQTALSRGFAFFLIVFFFLLTCFWRTRDHPEGSPCSPPTIPPPPRLPPPPLVMAVKRQTCSYIMVTSDWKVELKRRSNRRRCSCLTLSPRLCAKKCHHFDWGGSCTWKREPNLFSPLCCCFFVRLRHLLREIFLLQSDSLGRLPVITNESSSPPLEEAVVIRKHGTILRVTTVAFEFFSAFATLIRQFIGKKIRHGFHGSHDIRWQHLYSVALGLTGLNQNLMDLICLKIGEGRELLTLASPAHCL